MKSRIAQLALAGAVVGTMMMPAISSAQEAAGPNTGKLSLEAGVDFVSHYIFRGISQENEGIMAQPWANLGFSVYKSDGPVSNVKIVTGLWNSFHTEPTGFTGGYYEADIKVGVEATVMEKWNAAVSYIWYVYPDPAISTIQEVDLRIGYDDTGVFPDIMGRPFALQPYVLLAFETQNPNTRNNAIYAEVGIAPSWTIDTVQDWPVTLSVPVTVGMSLDDYYLDATGNDDFFGYVSVGVKGSVPLKFIPSDYGQWSATAGVVFYYLGDNAADAASPAITGASGNQFQVVGLLGVAMKY